MAELDEQPFDWVALVPHTVHPMKVGIIEAIHWIGTPLSATDVVKLCGNEFSVSYVSYHFTSLAKAGVLKKVRQRQVRGSTETFYFFQAR